MKADKDNEVFGLTVGNATVKPTAGIKNVYLMPVKGQAMTIEGNITGETTLWKSQQGVAVMPNSNSSTSKTIVSEGTLQVDGEIKGMVDLRARGTLSGKGSVGSLVVEGALNYEGCRLMPLGMLTIASSLSINNKTYVEVNIDNGSKVKVKGNLALTAPIIFTVVSEKNTTGEYRLMEYDGTLSGDIKNISVRGLTGLSYNVINKDNAICLVINGQREAAKDVKWTGAVSNVWDYQTKNWELDDTPVTFVANDDIVFGEEAKKKTVTIAELMPIGNVEVNSTSTYAFSGKGGFSGTGSLIKNGSGNLTLSTVNSNYTGATIINSGKVTVKELADGGVPSSIGAASVDAANLQIGKATFYINNTNTATNRGITLTDTATVQIESGTTSFKGIIKGKGILRKIGSGQLNITYAGTNSWAGTILEGGTLAMGAWNTTFGGAYSPIHVTGNSTISIFDVNSSSTMPNFQNAVTIDTLKTLTFNVGSRCTVRGTLQGSGTIKMSFKYVRGDVYTDVSKFRGTYDVTTSNCRFVQAMDFSNATLWLESGAYAAGFKAANSGEQAYNNKVGRLRGLGTLGSGTWNVYDLGVDDKTTAASIGTLTINGTLVIPAGKTVNVRSYASTSTFKNDTYVNNGATNINSPHFVMTQLVNKNSFVEGREIKVFSGTGKITVSGKPTFSPLRPAKGCVWDASRLSSDGIIDIVAAPYILGDANGDKVVNMADANLIVNYFLGIPVEGIDMEAADVDGDGKVTMADANEIANIIK